MISPVYVKAGLIFVFNSLFDILFWLLDYFISCFT